MNSDINVPNKSYSKQTDAEKNRRISRLSSSCIYGTDANPRMARTSKMNMIMHGDGHGGVHHHDGLINVNGIFENRFDVILTNPPFGARIEKDYKLSETDRFYDKDKLKEYQKRYGDDCIRQIKELNNAIDNGQKILDRFDLGKVSGLTEVLFMERCLKLLKPGGRMGIVLPEGVLNNSNLQKVRDYFESEARANIEIGLSELVTNAIEHGNLDITFEEKSEMLKTFSLEDLYSKRLKDKKLADRKVTVEYAFSPEKCEWTITDEGNGFDPNAIPDPLAEENLESLHGRGIFFSRHLFDSVEYLGKGNIVHAVKICQKSAC